MVTRLSFSSNYNIGGWQPSAIRNPLGEGVDEKSNRKRPTTPLPNLFTIIPFGDSVLSTSLNNLIIDAKPTPTITEL